MKENNSGSNFRLVVWKITPDMYDRAVEVCSEWGLGEGKVYDALLIECARHSQADRIYTFNLGDFRRLAPDLAERMVAP